MNKNTFYSIAFGEEDFTEKQHYEKTFTQLSDLIIYLRVHSDLYPEKKVSIARVSTEDNIDFVFSVDLFH